MKLGMVSDCMRGGGETLEHSVCDEGVCEVAATATIHNLNYSLHNLTILQGSIIYLHTVVAITILFRTGWLWYRIGQKTDSELVKIIIAID